MKTTTVMREVPRISAVDKAVGVSITRGEVSGAVTAVVRADGVVHCGAGGFADIGRGRQMAADTLFWIASMTKPVIAVAALMLRDEGAFALDDPVARFIPEFAGIRTAEGNPRMITIRQLFTHTSGLAEATPAEMASARTLADLVPAHVAKPLLYEPGSKWLYCQSCINTIGRIIEVISGKGLPEFLAERLFSPLGMTDTGFFPGAEQQARMALPYALIEGRLVPAQYAPQYDPKRPHFPAANGGLFSTAGDYARFCRMLLNDGELDGKRYLSKGTVAEMATVQTGDLKAGFIEGTGWGLGVGVARVPQGVTSMFSPGSFGHGGAYGTQAWIDPVKRVAYILLVQRSNFPNADTTDVRRAFQAAAHDALFGNSLPRFGQGS